MPNSKDEPTGVSAYVTENSAKPVGQIEDYINDDDRAVGEWKSRWPPEAVRHIRIEALYICIVLFLTFCSLILTWNGMMFRVLSTGCDTCVQERFDAFAFTFLGGLLGGTLFGIKYLYRVVARGYWNLDRRLWRLFSPFISGGLALAMGTLLDSGILGLSAKSFSVTYFFSLGFISGYFADSALAKMQEIAETVFGSHSNKHSRNK